MKKSLFLALAVVLISACGVQRPNPLTIELINSNSGAVPFAQQGYQAVIAYSLYEVRVDWDVTNTGAQGVQIVAAKGTDYYCQTPIASVTYYVVNSKAMNTNAYTDSLGQLFLKDIDKFTPGSYAICLKAVMYDSVSEPSLPVFLELR